MNASLNMNLAVSISVLAPTISLESSPFRGQLVSGRLLEDDF